jgi:cyclic pyranopterin phosphate synthase
MRHGRSTAGRKDPRRPGQGTETTLPSVELEKEPCMSSLNDRFGRRFCYLRLSITDVCNFRCEYCLPNGYRGTPRGFLDAEEIRRLVTAFAELGTWKVRLTGGEPMVRRDFVDIVRTIRAVPGVERLAMTTNAYRLAATADELRTAGMNAINVSLDALNAGAFKRITGDKRFDKVMRGIDAALEAGFDSLKINTVLLNGLNQDQLPAFLEFVRNRPISVRFIELMRTGDNGAYFDKRHLGGDAVRDVLVAYGWSACARGPGDGPAQEYQHPEYRGRIGLIAPYAPGFCDSCNRLRVTALGGLRLCLFGHGSADLRPLLQHDAQKDELKTTIVDALFDKRSQHRLHEADYGDTPHLAMTGG